MFMNRTILSCVVINNSAFYILLYVLFILLDKQSILYANIMQNIMFFQSIL